jgi:hypothetical protein
VGNIALLVTIVSKAMEATCAINHAGVEFCNRHSLNVPDVVWRRDCAAAALFTKEQRLAQSINDIHQVCVQCKAAVLLNALPWCGQEQKDPFEFRGCPSTSAHLHVKQA